MKLLVTAPQGVIRESFLPKQVRDRLESVAEVEYNTLSRNWTPEELRDRLHGVDVALTGWGTTLFDETVLAGADRLRLIAHTGGSVTPVMSDAAYDRGIRVISGNEMYAESVAESVIAYALTALRKIPDYLERTRNGGWYENGEVWEGLLDQTVGIIGFGMTSRHLFRMGKAFRLKFKVLEKELKERFDKIDTNAEYNQLKVIAAMQKNKVSAECFQASSGYGYNDLGRDTLERVYADCFGAEDALVRPQITCGTHALALALMSNLRPGDELLSPVGKPYDTLEEVIGIRPSKGSLAEYGITYAQVDLLPDGEFDYDGIKKAINEKTKSKPRRKSPRKERVKTKSPRQQQYQRANRQLS